MAEVEIVKADVREAWPFVVQGLAVLKNRLTMPANWNEKDLLAKLLLDEDTELFLVRKDQQPMGFFVLRYLWEEFTHRKICHIWVAYLKPQVNLLKEVYPFIEDWARSRKCKVLMTTSQRPGMQVLARKVQGHLYEAVYRKFL